MDGVDAERGDEEWSGGRDGVESWVDDAVLVDEVVEVDGGAV
jgi:hypothetical protein